MSESPQAPPVVWQPLPGSQELAISCPCNVLLYEGSRGPGKTDAQIMAFRQHVGKGYGKFWRGVIFDREYKNLDDLIAKSERWFPAFKDGARFLRSKSDYKWVWPTGEELLFRQFAKESDYWNYHGQEFPFIGWNEVSKFALPKPIDLMMSCNRSGFLPEVHTPKLPDGSYDTPDGAPIEELPLRVFMTTNPYGPGHMWIKKRYIDPAPAGEVVTKVTNVFNPRTQKREDITKTTVRLFGSYKENIYLSPEYVAELENITDTNRRKAWLEGCWDIVAGGALDDVWQEQTHILPDFRIPENWYVDRCFDWGSSHPFSCGWYAEANGEEVELPDGRLFCPPAGTLIRFFEWYGAKSLGENEGLRLGSKEVAGGIIEREMKLISCGRIADIPHDGPADGEIYGTKDKAVLNIADNMEEEGITWYAADKSKGTRKSGLELMRARLKNSVTGEGPGLYFTRSCKAAIALLPVLPRDEVDPDDVDTTAEDHVYDEVRYRVLDASNKHPGALKVSFPT